MLEHYKLEHARVPQALTERWVRRAIEREKKWFSLQVEQAVYVNEHLFQHWLPFCLAYPVVFVVYVMMYARCECFMVDEIDNHMLVPVMYIAAPKFCMKGIKLKTLRTQCIPVIMVKRGLPSI